MRICEDAAARAIKGDDDSFHARVDYSNYVRTVNKYVSMCVSIRVW